MTNPADRRNGFTRAATLVQPRIRGASESRGFSVARVLTHWSEVVGPDLARLCRPVAVSYGKGGFGATLTVLASGTAAPLVDMARPRILDRVNAAYGYRAVAHLRITQTGGPSFAEAQAPFMPPAPPPEAEVQAAHAAEGVADTELRLALARLGAHVLSRPKR